MYTQPQKWRIVCGLLVVLVLVGVLLAVVPASAYGSN